MSDLRLTNIARLFLTLMLAVAATACMTVKLVSDYDEQIDHGLTQLYADTSSFVERMISLHGTPAGSYDANQQFYNEATGRVDALMARAQANQVLNNCPTTRVMARILAAANRPADAASRPAEAASIPAPVHLDISTVPDGSCEVVVLQSLKRALENMRTFHRSQGANGVPEWARPIMMEGGLGAAFRAGIMIEVAKRGNAGSGGR